MGHYDTGRPKHNDVPDTIPCEYGTEDMGVWYWKMTSLLEECCKIIQLVAIKFEILLHAGDVGIILGVRSAGVITTGRHGAYNICLIDILEHVAEEASGQEEYVKTPDLFYRQ